MGRYFFMLLISIRLLLFFLEKELNFLIYISSIMEKFFLFLSTIFFFYSISIISLPEALTLSFVSPIIVTVLSIFYLDEKVGIHRWTAVFLGFIGVLIIIRPGSL